MLEKINRSEQEWKRILTAEQYEIMREKGTEPAHSCAWKDHGEGIYHCAACDLPLFESKAKFESGTGWPSYFAPIDPEHVEESPDYTFSVFRTQVACARCGSHLGHVFEDLPSRIRQEAEKTGGLSSAVKRYCINSVSLKFEPYGKGN